ICSPRPARSYLQGAKQLARTSSRGPDSRDQCPREPAVGANARGAERMNEVQGTETGAQPNEKFIVHDAFRCQVCGGAARLFDVVDFNKSCEEARGKFL